MSRQSNFPSSAPSIVVSFCLASGILLMLNGCGQKGPLKPSAPAPAPSASAPAADKPQTTTSTPDKK